MKSIVATKGMAILQADTDRLKYINDNFSHFHGDQAIIRTYNILEKYLASIARIYRVGGDEFTIIIENYDKDTLDKIIEQIRQDAKAVHAQSDYDFSISIGIAEFDPSVDKNIYFTAIRADQQMYDDKKRLRKTVPQKFPVKKE